jgi:hypothetical protein
LNIRSKGLGHSRSGKEEGKGRRERWGSRGKTTKR